MNTGNGAWSTASSGANGAANNRWFISCAENGNAVGTCGSGCGSNATLHVGANPGSYCTCFVCAALNGDCGAAYDACSALSNFCGGSSPQTNQRATSPLISTSGKSGISVSFDYIENGQGATDDGLAYYSTDGGVTWPLLVNTAKTSTGCGGQGIWANYTSGTLPVAADNIANFRISFVWVNNTDDTGNDPSYAINDLKIRYTSLLPIELLDFHAAYVQSKMQLTWITKSEANNAYFTIQRSQDGSAFTDVLNVKGAGNSNTELHYSAEDVRPLPGISYYRLKQTDFDGKYSYSELAAVELPDELDFEIASLYSIDGNSTINAVILNPVESAISVQLVDLTGRIVYSHQGVKGNKRTDLTISTAGLPGGIYTLKVYNGYKVKCKKFIL